MTSPDRQDPEYLEGAHEVIRARLHEHLDLHPMAADRLAHSVLDALAEAGWWLVTVEDAQKMIDAYTLQQVR